MIYIKHFVGDPFAIDDQKGIPVKFISLNGIYPNPASDRTTIGITVAKPVNLKIEVTSVLGQVVRTIDLGRVIAGSHQVAVDVSGLKSGVYQYTVIAGGERASGKLVKE
jgi:flagellar hook assembly protein FlgD